MASAASRRLLILYGSQTGTAKEVAERLARGARRHHFAPVVQYMDAYPKQNLPTESLVVFVASTCGQGETPDNMAQFWRFLRRKDLPRNSLAALNFTVFGLGDSSYPIYNAVARRLYQRLLALGATAVHPRGLGDDQHPKGYDGDLVPWEKGLWEALLRQHPLPAGLEVIPASVKPVPAFTVTVEEGEKQAPLPAENSRAACERMPSFGEGANRYRPFAARVTMNQRITSPEHFQDVRHVEFDLAGSGLSYSPGDVLAVHPRNPREATLAFLEAYGLSPRAMVSISPNPASDIAPAPADTRIPAHTPALELFECHLDLFGTPRRYFFERLAHFAEPGSAVEEKLKDFASADYQDDLHRYCIREKRTFAEVLADFPTIKVPLQHLVEMIPRLQPRLFSIASALEACPNRAQLAVAILKFTTPYKRERTGVCSSFLASLDVNAAGDKGVYVPVWVQRGSFRMPDPRRPCLMIGPGTGIAPFRSMCQLRAVLAQRHKDSEEDGAAALGPCHVFYGNRNREGDFFFRQEWEAMEKEGVVSTLHTAFSRDQPEKIYVQHRLLEQADTVWAVLGNEAEGGCLLLAGNAKRMPKDVRNAVLRIFQETGGLSEEAARALMKRLDAQKRYIVETW